MNTRDPLKPGKEAFDKFGEQIRRALMEEGAIIPETIEEVRQAKARLKKQPVTLPPHLRHSSAIGTDEKAQIPSDKVVVLAEARSLSSSESNQHHHRKASNEFVEAILIAQFTREMSTPEFPLGHLRQNKLVYFAHRKADEDVAEHFMKKAAGPYSQWATYKGPEGIAQKNGYVRRAKVGGRVGFLVGDNIGKIDQYVSRYPACAAVDWVVSHFRRKRNEILELYATVDFAALDLAKEGTPITMENVKRIIATHCEWKAKLQREIFSDTNIARALAELRLLFPATYA
jgi:hypothetical protein